MKGSAMARRGFGPGQRGFTLIEMMVVLVILGILMSLAAPSFYNVLLSGKLSTYANDLALTARLARSEAIKRNGTVTLCVSSNGTTCGTGNWNQGWIVLSGTTVIQNQAAIASGFSIASGVSSLTFQPSGLASTPATFTVCRATPTVGSQERVVTITVSGRTSITTTNNGSCS